MSKPRGRPLGPAKETPWTNTAITIRKTTLKTAIEDTLGNITAAARSLGIHRAYCSKLVSKAGLKDYAAMLRIKNMGRDRGRPWD